MQKTAARISDRIASLERALQAAEGEIKALLALSLEVEAGDRGGAAELLRVAEVIGRDGQAREGQLLQILAQADRVKAHRGGLAPWISGHLDATDGSARGLARSAREIGRLPELAEPLTSGRIGSATIRTLTRSARAAKAARTDVTEALTATLETATEHGVAQARRQVRVLEETLEPGRGEKLLEAQRRRSFLRLSECESGMTRLEALLDPEAATTVRAAVDQSVSAALRERQFDRHPVPEHLTTVEQLQARALTRFAEVFLTATPAQREAAFTAQVLYHAPLDPAQDAGLAETCYGQLVPRKIVAPPTHPAAHLLQHAAGQPVLLDGQPLDRAPAARLASPAQRTALAWRDRTCTYPGCHRPPTWEPLRFNSVFGSSCSPRGAWRWHVVRRGRVPASRRMRD